MPKSDTVHFNIELTYNCHNTEKVLRLCGMLTVRVPACPNGCYIPLHSIKLVYRSGAADGQSVLICAGETQATTASSLPSMYRVWSKDFRINILHLFCAKLFKAKCPNQNMDMLAMLLPGKHRFLRNLYIIKL